MIFEKKLTTNHARAIIKKKENRRKYSGLKSNREGRWLRISTRGEYGVRAMFDLALHYGQDLSR